MQSEKVFLSLRTNRWGFTRAYGMQMIGPQGVVWLRQIGQRHRLRLIIAISTHRARLLLRGSRMGHGRTSNLMHIVEEDWDGFRRISWFITIALIQSDSLKVHHQSADDKSISRRFKYDWWRLLLVLCLVCNHVHVI